MYEDDELRTAASYPFSGMHHFDHLQQHTRYQVLRSHYDALQYQRAIEDAVIPQQETDLLGRVKASLLSIVLVLV